CKKKLSQASKVKQHLLKMHNLHLQSRSEGKTRGNTQQFTYVSEGHKGKYTSVLIYYACVSCLSHYPDLDQLKSHINDIH
ncbi:hypothetical protein BDB00DRAFT_752657, partial [Zychaea mexicana]|uniref:uncharacterized protein n=1 Tax=Zychaea mexicana TaxID=64656 RepID=UPI0022FF272C